MNALNGQNLFDIVVSSMGDINNLFTILSANGLNVDDSIQSGQKISIPNCQSVKEIFLTTSNPDIQNPVYVKSQQNTFDLTVQYYGDMSLFFQVIDDNSFEVETIPQSGQKITLHVANRGNEKIKKQVILNKLTFANAVQIIKNKKSGKAFSDAFSKEFD